MANSPQLFDVMPSGELKRALRQSLSSETQIAWEKIGELTVTEGQLGVVDASACHPRHYREAKVLEWPHPRVEVWLQLARHTGDRLGRVFAVLLSVPGEELGRGSGSWQTQESVTMPIDSASAAVADYGRLSTQCRDGGPLCDSCLGKGSADDPQSKQARQQAAALLNQHGFPTKIETWATGSISVYFKPGLSDEQVSAANLLLEQAGFSDRAWIAGSHTAGEIEQNLINALHTRVPADGDPFGYAFTTGFGDGIYYWDSLWRDGKLCGYLCNFVPTDEEASSSEGSELAPLEMVSPGAATAGDAEEVLDLESVEESGDRPWAELAPATVPGVLVAVRISRVYYRLGRVEARLPTGWEVQYPMGQRASVVAAQVVPIPDRPVFSVGDNVLALWNESDMYPGVITAMSEQGYMVAWSDGDTPKVVAPGTLTYLAWTTA